MKKYTRESHARGDATAGPASRGFAACWRVLTRLASLAQIGLGELAHRLARLMPLVRRIYMGRRAGPLAKIPVARAEISGSGPANLQGFLQRFLKTLKDSIKS